VEILTEMKNDDNVKPDEISYNTIIKGCSIVKNYELGDNM